MQWSLLLPYPLLCFFLIYIYIYLFVCVCNHFSYPSVLRSAQSISSEGLLKDQEGAPLTHQQVGVGGSSLLSQEFPAKQKRAVIGMDRAGQDRAAGRAIGNGDLHRVAELG